MKRQRQSLEELLGHLSPVDTGWQDAHAEAVIQRLNSIQRKPSYSRDDLARLLGDPTLMGKLRTEYFNEGLTTVRLFLDMSKDEFKAALRDRLGPGIGITRLRQDPECIYSALEDRLMGLAV